MSLLILNGDRHQGSMDGWFCLGSNDTGIVHGRTKVEDRSGGIPAVQRDRQGYDHPCPEGPECPSEKVPL